MLSSFMNTKVASICVPDNFLSTSQELARYQQGQSKEDMDGRTKDEGRGTQRKGSGTP